MKIWIFNHYATDTFFERGGRHYSLAKYLKRSGYEVRVFCASTVHNSDINVDIPYGNYKEDIVDGIPYTFIKTPSYEGNGKSRIINMLSFYKRLFGVCRDCSGRRGKPDIILASSVHPLTLVAGIKIAKKFNIPCICEVRDLWPESLVAYDIIRDDHPLTGIMYKGEKWIYKNADAIIFTMPDGGMSITDKGWDKTIDMSKVFNVNNGVDLEVFEYNKNEYRFEDEDLDSDKIKLIYAGSVRKVNSVGFLVDVADRIKDDDRYKIIVFGDGDELESIIDRKEEKGLDNIVFKGRVEKKYIPYILSKGDINLISGDMNEELSKYGLSLNKMFEYMASGHPIIATLKEGKTKIIDNPGKRVGVSRKFESADDFVNALYELTSEEEYDSLCRNAVDTARQYDFSHLTAKLIDIINGMIYKDNATNNNEKEENTNG